MATQFIRAMQRSITITNASGSTQSYALYAAPPNITPTVSDINTNAILVLRGVACTSGQAYFTIPKTPLYAVCGTSYGGESTVETQVEVLDTRPIQIGQKKDDGVLVAGTTLELLIRKGTPTFAPKADVPSSGDEGCFCIRTSNEFTHSEARAGDFVVGISLYKKLSRYVGPFATFRPAPGMEYQIEPLNRFYLAVGDYAARSRMTKGVETRSCLVDFCKLELDNVQIFHTPHGQLTVKSDFNED
ncbi:hypothetical protein E4T42_08722 [Aureobasidium subglaciale]|uniref:Uncharacterized protein n=1 Tax=Aureobasidium subglaciale (strain EXF-2481) TaxID=1043005 RepID=A0A074YET1_AURSE|nr:uncharacterized protein AUEXF2481DRAFT_87736 [Aureobasidium subglaciale EXF-2481]KAI5201224.1 hypothetical protein E4T38_06128 [Aureobasidium subglaciale]KAI5219898.1 hypothetical protein E4T40_06149 [Aureobasidium subglaciale]KAI5223640.1 hypothetical protein E4T41_06048 [Aureobasidium subglaciale]KAI5239363.1 hypothetical protein E4T42_08722 [Aureobasidium subglaciale]KAI5260550.1 hypothetical protein E4T46_05883 [Aureobasidium subglaciale]